METLYTRDRDTLDEIFDSAVNWISADADNPDTPPEAWQVCFEYVRTAVNAHDELVAALKTACAGVNRCRNGDTFDLLVPHKIVDQMLAALAKATSD